LFLIVSDTHPSRINIIGSKYTNSKIYYRCLLVLMVKNIYEHCKSNKLKMILGELEQFRLNRNTPNVNIKKLNKIM